MPANLNKLRQLQARADQANQALRDAQDRLGQARDRVQRAIRETADLEARAVTDLDVDPADVGVARQQRADLIAALTAVETDLST